MEKGYAQNKWLREVRILARANRDCPLTDEEYQAVRALARGESVVIGGGAGAEMRVTRTRLNTLRVE